jgi:hypothetical protein
MIGAVGECFRLMWATLPPPPVTFAPAVIPLKVFLMLRARSAGVSGAVAGRARPGLVQP